MNIKSNIINIYINFNHANIPVIKTVFFSINEKENFGPKLWSTFDHSAIIKSGHPRRPPLPAENLHQTLPQRLHLIQVSDYRRKIFIYRWDQPTQIFEITYHLQGASIRTEIPGCDQPLIISCQVLTLNLSNVKYIWAYINQYSPIKRYQTLYETMVYILLKMGKTYCGNSSYLWS